MARIGRRRARRLCHRRRGHRHPQHAALFSDRPDDFFLHPNAIADTVYHLVQQPRSAWTFEVDVRPFGEKW
jgi:hypothetical protein